MKKICLTAILILFASFSGCSCSPESRDIIFLYVNDKNELLETFPYDELEKLGRWDNEYSDQLSKNTSVIIP